MTKHLAKWLILIILMVCGFTYIPMSGYITGHFACPTDPLYGAKGDGVTDDTAAVQAAVTAVGNAGGGVVAFAPGTYLINNGHIIIPSNVTMDGLALGSVTILCSRATGSNYYGIFTNADRVNGNDNITIKNLIFHRTVQVSFFDEHIYMRHARHLLIDHCSFIGVSQLVPTGAKGLSLDQPLYSTISNNYFSLIPNNAIVITGIGNTSTYSQIINNVVICRNEPGNDPLILTADGVTVEGNYFFGGTNEIATENGVVCSGNEFIGNTFCASLLELRGQKDCIVTGNYFNPDPANGNSSGIFAIQDNPGQRSLENLVISNNVVFGGAGITVGLNSDTPGLDVTIEGNILEGSGTTSTTASKGITTYLINNLIVRGNTVNTSWDGGLQILTCNSPIIDANIVINPVYTTSVGFQEGIWLWRCQNPVVTCNKVIDKNVSSLLLYGYAIEVNYGIEFCDNSLLSYSGAAQLMTKKTSTISFTKKSGNIVNMIPVDPTVRFAAAVPTADTWHAQQVIWSTVATSSNPMGWYCTAGGTFSTYSSTGNTTTGSPVITSVPSTSGLQAGQYVSVAAGFATTGPYMVLELTANSITINALATGNRRGTAVTCPAPTFKAMPNYP